MTDELKMDYEMMETMRQSFVNGAEQLEEVRVRINQIAEMSEEGALVGKGGTKFQEALTYNLASSVRRLYDKFHELAGDIEGAVSDMRSADESSSSNF